MMNIAIYDPSQEDGQALEALVRQMMEGKAEGPAEADTFTSLEKMLDSMYTCQRVFDIVFLSTDGTADDMTALSQKVREYNRFCPIIFIGPQDISNLELMDIPGAAFIKKPLSEAVVEPALDKALAGYDPEKARHVLIRTARKTYDLLLDNLLYLSSCRRIVTLYTRQGFTFSCYTKLGDLEALISDRRFLRCHQSYLANMDYITNIVGHTFIMEGGAEVKIRQSGISKIKERYFAWALGRY